jgi:3-deoxy-D-manno-octulosonate 8-phosphate phosphatase (KDO 8-P phosphatase)
MQHLYKQAAAVKLLILDVDGVLSDGRIYMSSHGEPMKNFHTRDGIGIKQLQQANIAIAVISGCNSSVVSDRMAHLGVTHVYQGYNDKLPVYQKLLQELNLQDHEVAYMGDDWPDMPMLKRVGLSATVADAPHYIKEQVHFVSQAAGGCGAVRELCDLLLHAHNQFHIIHQQYLV